MTFKLGLTGSIGMGKSTTAELFMQNGCDVWDADAAVHRLYSAGGRAVEPVGAEFPDAIVDGEVSRDQLRKIIAENPDALRRIEEIVHPLLSHDRADFVASASNDILVFDIPLLFETGGDANMDAVVCVTVPEEVQRARVLERGTMDEAQFDSIKAKQMPSDEKCKRADYVVETDTLDHAAAQVRAIVNDIRRGRDA
ncbi:dephospho-CoA kinase [Sediminimonas qiaohouensis]|uniref:dephospho-CoA kinase n=1 Tax=Sediminimonas qiaohouensis TaxID=552061 RepID=UPI000479070F|nr:dephospho-CoA kinase [Sediminimonas qiaohouensis]